MEEEEETVAINCVHWSRKGIDSGHCAVGAFKGPSIGICSQCKQRETKFPEKPTVFGNVVKFAKSMKSRGVGNERVELEIFQQRVTSCHGDEKTPPCPARRYYKKGKWHYCNDCNCTAKKMARLSAAGSDEDKPVVDHEGEYIKLLYPYVDCPRGRPGFSGVSKAQQDTK